MIYSADDVKQIEFNDKLINAELAEDGTLKIGVLLNPDVIDSNFNELEMKLVDYGKVIQTIELSLTKLTHKINILEAVMKK